MRWWRKITRRLGAPDLMRRMFERFGVREMLAGHGDVEAAHILRAAAVRCMSCNASRQCEQWLDEAQWLAETGAPGKATTPIDVPPSWCRNAELVSALKRGTGALH